MSIVSQYITDLQGALDKLKLEQVEELSNALFIAWLERRRVFICGNGGSAGNAIHIANDFTYGIDPDGLALDIEALSSNPAVITCLANDIGYENIFAHQLKVKARKDDILIVLSGSGNSENIVRALKHARLKGMYSCSILGFDGGKAKSLSNNAIHIPLNDMQIAEDIQIVIGHMLMKDLHARIKQHQSENHKIHK